MVAVEITTHEGVGIRNQPMICSRRELENSAVAIRHTITHEGAAAGSCRCRCCIELSQLGGGEADFGFDQGHGRCVTAKALLRLDLFRLAARRNRERNAEIRCSAGSLGPLLRCNAFLKGYINNGKPTPFSPFLCVSVFFIKRGYPSGKGVTPLQNPRSTAAQAVSALRKALDRNGHSP